MAIDVLPETQSRAQPGHREQTTPDPAVHQGAWLRRVLLAVGLIAVAAANALDPLRKLRRLNPPSCGWCFSWSLMGRTSLVQGCQTEKYSAFRYRYLCQSSDVDQQLITFKT